MERMFRLAKCLDRQPESALSSLFQPFFLMPFGLISLEGIL